MFITMWAKHATLHTEQAPHGADGSARSPRLREVEDLGVRGKRDSFYVHGKPKSEPGTPGEDEGDKSLTRRSLPHFFKTNYF